MKNLTTKKFITTIFIFLYINCYSQAIAEGDIITLKTYCNVIKKVPINSSVFVPNLYVDNLEPDIKFRVNKITDSEVELIATDFSSLTPTQTAKLNLGQFDKSLYYNQKKYTISKTDFDKSAVKVIPILSVGILSLPFKARLQSKRSFDAEFNINSTLNYKIYKIYNANLNLQFGGGIGIIELNNSNSNGIANSDSQSVGILSLLSGIMIDYKNVQFGIYTGMDYINNQKKYVWDSDGNIWFGLGIGVNLFRVGISDTANKQT